MKKLLDFHGFSNTTWGWIGFLSGYAITAFFAVAFTMLGIEAIVWAWRYWISGTINRIP